jgi:hypothetical protein
MEKSFMVSIWKKVFQKRTIIFQINPIIFQINPLTILILYLHNYN